MSDNSPSVQFPTSGKFKIRGKNREEARGLAKIVLDELFKGKKTELHDDYAAIIAFLVDVEAFTAIFKLVDKDVAQLYEMKKTEKNRLTSSFFDLFEAYGASFPRVQNVVMVGSSFKVFGGIINNGIHFKDATGPGHGEYSHTLQWLVIARAVREDQFKLKNKVTDLYRGSAGQGTLCGTQLIGQDKALQSFTYWNLLVDCFTEEDLGMEENAFENLVSSTFRSPGYLTRTLRGGVLNQTFLGAHLNNRYTSEKRVKNGQMNAEVLREYQKEKQKKKGTMIANLSDGVNLILPTDSPEALLKELERRKVQLNEYKNEYK